ncbi:Virulence protein RhuM family protein [Desulfofustis glycolicus DSM 9705]|uniref:Virulence protein RhuM family protein n=1 Tax=Desulfofustis glycolicus DSM 9705 TaxID=1121409 RepID=A0A1M5YGP3_9BACT|nr:RhuM family protein [Desulfofustis glycolicus]SHI11028.1 Virulence protein RhuM family protein [Desulfofustis glycolicus DSM 9705]
MQFRKWATTIIQEFTIKGYTMDDERLKNDGSVLGKQYFEEQLQRLVSAYLDVAEDEVG